MIASVIGRTFLAAFNSQYKQSLSARQFFEEYYFKLFFDHPKYMQWITNSPFVQMKSGQKPHLLNSDERKEKLENLHMKIASGKPEASIAIGFPAAEEGEFASTSGLVSDISIPVDSEEVYFSWIGSGLGLGVAGGYSIFFDHAEILLKLFEGWKIYRNFLNEPSLSRLRGNQINTWNGQWLSFVWSSKFREDFDYAYLEQTGLFATKAGDAEALTINWTELYFAISKKMPDALLTGYVYSLGQTNKTIGFIPFQFKSGVRLKDIYKKLFPEEQRIDPKTFESLFGVHIKRACELGTIGMQALRPEKLKAYFQNSSLPAFKKPEDIISFHAYKTWLTAMLSKNKEEITDYTERIAAAILRYRAAGTKTNRKNLLENEMFPAKSKKTFLDGLAQIICDADETDLELFRQLRNEIHLMTNEEFGYFTTLLKFDYAYQDRNIKK